MIIYDLFIYCGLCLLWVFVGIITILLNTVDFYQNTVLADQMYMGTTTGVVFY